MFYPRSQTTEERLSSYATRNDFGKNGKILRGLSKNLDRQGWVQFELKMRPQAGMRVTPELGWDFHMPFPFSDAIAATLNALMVPRPRLQASPGSGAVLAAHPVTPVVQLALPCVTRPLIPAGFYWWGRELQLQQKSWILPHHGQPLRGT